MYQVYIVTHPNNKNDIIYIGYTNNLSRRNLEHTYNCYSIKSKTYDKKFYQKWRSIYPDKTEIVLTLVKSFKSRVDAKRYEMFLILLAYFRGRNLFQKIPNISDYR